MKILFINNDGGGFADYIDVPEAPPCKSSLRSACPAANRRTT